ncbi:hypothetical protein [Nostoc punctiforme]|uniref:Uncharacterized protein n=1 Tax=Nostoc punctiforme (strain ATCC 29133 / PCC 73102) TaxID=63737 RepID=B2J080_NOSP7|nr:hypothetical protein [Nostoc punctiforme]ACC83232.1 hypothetical protein Npun_F4886 [Nostoc punctiforme PCC 73102]
MNVRSEILRESPIEVKRKTLNKRYTDLLNQYTLANQKIDETIEESERYRRQQEADRLYSDLEAVDRKLKQLDKQSINSNRRYLNLEQDIAKIDFEQVMEKIDEIIRGFRRGVRGDALIIVQENLAMAGDLCIKRIQERLGQETGDFKHIEIEFSPEGCLDKVGFLEKLAEYFNASFTKEPEQFEQDCIQLIIEKICGSLQGGSILFMEVRKWDELPCQEDIFQWFITSFWMPLIARLEIVSQTHRRVKFIGAIVADAEFSSSCIDFDYLCLGENPPKMLVLPLQFWTVDEIQEWLECYPGLDNPRSIQLAKRIHRASQKGIPSLVCTALRKEFIA